MPRPRAIAAGQDDLRQPQPHRGKAWRRDAGRQHALERRLCGGQGDPGGGQVRRPIRGPGPPPASWSGDPGLPRGHHATVNFRSAGSPARRRGGPASSPPPRQTGRPRTRTPPGPRPGSLRRARSRRGVPAARLPSPAFPWAHTPRAASFRYPGRPSRPARSRRGPGGWQTEAAPRRVIRPPPGQRAAARPGRAKSPDRPRVPADDIQDVRGPHSGRDSGEQSIDRSPTASPVSGRDRSGRTPRRPAGVVRYRIVPRRGDGRAGGEQAVAARAVRRNSGSPVAAPGSARNQATPRLPPYRSGPSETAVGVTGPPSWVISLGERPIRLQTAGRRPRWPPGRESGRLPPPPTRNGSGSPVRRHHRAPTACACGTAGRVHVCRRRAGAMRQGSSEYRVGGAGSSGDGRGRARPRGRPPHTSRPAAPASRRPG